jgi:hypothetical protein
MHAQRNDGGEPTGRIEEGKGTRELGGLPVPWPLLLLVSKTSVAFVWTVAIFSVDLGRLISVLLLCTVGKNSSRVEF